MGEVYPPWESEPGRDFVLGVLPANMAADRKRMNRFIQRALRLRPRPSEHPCEPTPGIIHGKFG